MNPLSNWTAFADAWWSCVLHSTWQSSLVALAAFALVWLRRKRSASFLYAVLVVALLKFLVPPIISLPVLEGPDASPVVASTSEMPLAATPVESTAPAVSEDSLPQESAPAIAPPAASTYAAELETQSASSPAWQPMETMEATTPPAPQPVTNTALPAPTTPQPALSVALPAPPAPEPMASAELPAPPPPVQEFNMLEHWKALLMLLHGLGIAALALLMAGSYLHLRRLLRAAMPANEELSTLANEVAARMRLRRRVSVLLTAAPCAPMATGLFKRRILLPDALAGLKPEEMRAILAHELAHHRRLDLAFIWVEHLVTLLWWFNPLVWMLIRALHRKREDCCDDVVLSLGLTGDSEYCDTLLRAAKRLHRPLTPRLIFGCASKLHPMAERLTRIMDSAVRRRAALTAWGTAGVIVMGLVLLPTFLPVAAGSDGALTDTDEARTNTDAAQTAEAGTEPSAVSPAAGLATGGGATGVVRGVVTNGATGKPVSGAFVAIDHSGDAGGSNLERFNKEGLYVTAETDAEGRFALEGVALRDGHPFYVTAPGFVRYEDAISLTPQQPEQTREVQLQPGATIVATWGDRIDESAGYPMVRLTASDLRLFRPRRDDWPASPYRLEKASGGRHNFSELAPGHFRIEAIQLGPKTITYLGAAEVDVREAETVTLPMPVEPRNTKVTVTVPRDPYQSEKHPTTSIAVGPKLDLSIAPGTFLHPEDDRLNRILANAIVVHTDMLGTHVGLDWSGESGQKPINEAAPQVEISYLVNGLPAGTYTAVAFTIGKYPNFQSEAVYPQWTTFDVKEGDDITVRIPWIEPKGPYVAQETIQSQPAAKVDEEISAHYANADAEIQDYIRWTAKNFSRGNLWYEHDAFAQLAPEERERKTVQTVEALNAEYGRHLCPALAEAGALKDARLLPGLIKAASYHRDDSDYDCRPKWMAVSALGRQDDITAVPTLIPIVDHGNTNTRMWARASLVRLTGQNFKDDKQAWGKWWNNSANEPKIDLSQLKPWVPQSPAPAGPAVPPSGTLQPAAVPPESQAVVDALPGELIFKGTYFHRSRGGDVPTPSTVWIKKTGEGEFTAASYLPSINETTVAYVSKQSLLRRYEGHYHGRDGQTSFKRFLDLADGTVSVTNVGGEKDGQIETLTVPSKALFMPNSRPDSYSAHMGFFQLSVPSVTDPDDVPCYDWDNSGKGMASYTIRMENKGKEEITVPAGTFTANHVIETQLTSGDTWYKKRAGHVTDYWVLDNGVIVRVLRHREPYELQLLSVETPAELPGFLGKAEVRPAGTLTILSAVYGAQDSWIDLTEVLNQRIQNGTLEVQVSNELGGDPIYGAPKKLNVHYRVGEKTHAISLDELETLRLPDTGAAALPTTPEASTSGPAKRPLTPVSKTDDTVVFQREQMVQKLAAYDYTEVVTALNPRMVEDKNGNVTGIMSDNVTSVPLLSVIGLQNGDVVNTINGVIIDSDQRLLEVFQTFKDSTTFRLGVTRDGEPVTLSFSLE